MLGIDIQGLKEFISKEGKKQNVIAAQAGIGEPQMSLILQEKRKLEAGEYAAICRALNVPMERFLKDKVS